MNENKSWSKKLQQQTRNAISEIQVNPHDGKLHFKNRDNRHAFMNAKDLLGGELSLTDKKSGEVYGFADTNELLNTGWAID